MISEGRLAVFKMLIRDDGTKIATNTSLESAVCELLEERKQLVAIVSVVEKMFSDNAGFNDLDDLNKALNAWRGND